MKLKAQTTLLIAAMIVVAGVAISMLTGLWQTVGTRVPKLLEPVAADAGGEAAGSETAAAYDPADIRGSYTFGDIAKFFAIPVGDLATAFHVAEGEAAAFQVKNLEKAFDGTLEIGTASVRMFVACYLGASYTPTEEVWFPQSAAEVLAAKGSMTEAQAAYVAAHTVP